MWNPFKKKPLLNQTDELFQVETYRWLLKHFGGDDFYHEAKLILPTEDFFPSKVSSSQQAIEETFAQVKRYAGMENWACILEAQDEDPDINVGETLMVQNTETSPLGTFSVNDNGEAVISYNPALVNEPMQMVATFAHELAHYLTATAPVPPPGGWENWEFATDIAASFLGFGIFQANSAFNFRQYSSASMIGWRTSGGGYLSEAEHSYSLAIFLLLKGLSPDTAYPYCDRNIQAFLKKALDELNTKPYIQELLDVEYEAFNPNDSQA